jgi:hypothetical protein
MQDYERVNPTDVSPMKLFASLIMLVMLLAPMAQTQATVPTASTDFPVPGHGSLRLKLPDGWRSRALPLTDPASVTLHFTPAHGDAFDVQVTSVWLDSAKRADVTLDSIKAGTQHAAEGLLPHSVEKTVSLHELRGPQSIGFYYALTDREPGPGEFSNLTQGIFLTGDILSTFTILHRTSVPPEVAHALQAFAEATYVK